ncbi:MAG: hypothetical protein IKQ87_00240 [Clostridia bacterium]|nr:hypothetical protein [Clostridia bacterium]
MDFSMIVLIIGGVLLVLSIIPTIGTTKAERMGKVNVSDSKKRRIRLSNILAAAGILIMILAGILYSR